MAQNVLLDNSGKYPYHTYHGPLPHFNPSPFPPCPQNSITVTPPLPSTPPIQIFHFELKLFGITGGVHKYAQFGLFCAKILVHSSAAGYGAMSHCDSRNSGMKTLKKQNFSPQRYLTDATYINFQGSQSSNVLEFPVMQSVPN